MRTADDKLMTTQVVVGGGGPYEPCSMVALSDSQLRAVWAAADRLPVEKKRGVFLERLIAQLQLRGSRYTTTDLEDMVRSALSGLVQQSAA